ncbi:MAG: hypothetical protein ABSG62_02040 [Terracidiphilus sp.]|jgi:hypothetical protein
MRKSAFFLSSCILAIGQFTLSAQTVDSSQKQAVQSLPPIIISGLEAYKDKGPDDAVRAWIKGSAIDGSKDALTQANNLRQIQDYYGAYRAYEVISTRDITPKTRVVYLVLDFDKGPLFAKFVVYRPDRDWILANFTFNTKEEAILPTVIHMD